MLFRSLDGGGASRARIWASLSSKHVLSQVIPACQTGRAPRATLSSVDLLAPTDRLTEEMVVTVKDR